MSVDEVCGCARADQALGAEPVDREMVLRVAMGPQPGLDDTSV